MKIARTYYLCLAAIFLMALILRLSLAITFQGLSSPPSYSAQPDQIEYEQLAYHLSTGGGYTTPSGRPTAHRPPGTSFVLLPLYVVFGRSFAAGRIFFCLLSAATCLATAWLARQCYGTGVALVSAAWLALYPGHFYHSMHFESEVPYGLFLTLACGLTLYSFRSKGGVGGADVVAGVFWGLAVLTRPQIIFVLPLAWVLVVFSTHSFRSRDVLRLTIHTCALLCVLAPWVVRNAVVVGKPTLSTVGAYTFWGAHNDVVLHDSRLRGSWVRTSDLVDDQHPITGTEVEREAAMWKYGFEFVKHHLSQMPQFVAMKLWRLVSPFANTPNRPVFWAFALGWLVTGPPALVGVVSVFRDRRPIPAVLLAPVFATLVTTIIFYGSDRFRDSISPIFVILATRAAVNWGRAWFPSFDSELGCVRSEIAVWTNSPPSYLLVPRQAGDPHSGLDRASSAAHNCKRWKA